MKKILLSLMLILCFVNVHAAKINKLIFFGDSLSDNGNLYSLLLHVIPKSPPYFAGRFTNGTTWAENLGKYYYNKNYADYQIYAYGGATAIFHMPTTKFISPTLLEIEVDRYLLDSFFRDRSTVLFAIWIGGNDYMFNADAEPDSLTTQVVDKISWAIDTLRNYGGKNFLILNLPDLSKSPSIRGSGYEEQLHTLSVLHNQKLDAAIQKLQSDNPDITITTFNAFSMLNDVTANPNKYNKKYNVHLSNFNDACWTGGPWLRKTILASGLKQEIQQSIAANNVNTAETFDAEMMSNFIINNPALAQTYKMGKSYEQGNVPCANPDSYLFWDSIHPTAIVHQILSQMVVEELGKQIG